MLSPVNEATMAKKQAGWYKSLSAHQKAVARKVYKATKGHYSKTQRYKIANAVAHKAPKRARKGKT